MSCTIPTFASTTMSCTIPTFTSPSSSSLFLNSNTAKLDAPQSYRFAFPTFHNSHSASRFRVCASSSNNVSCGRIEGNPIFQKLKSYAGSAILVSVMAAMTAKLSALPARAETPVAAVLEQAIVEEKKEDETHVDSDNSVNLSEFVESNVEAVDTLKLLLQQKLDNAEYQEALQILEKLASAQPEVSEWKFLTARLMSEVGENENARKVFEEYLAVHPLSFEALFENALLMDRCGEGEAVIKRLEEALTTAEVESKSKEARDVRLIMAQIQLLQKNVEGALDSYQQLTEEDPNDFRPYFCRGMIYSLLDKNIEAKEEFAKYRRLSPKKLEVDGYLRTPLSRMKLVASDEN